MAGHADPRTTGFYDRPWNKVTRIIVGRISIGRNYPLFGFVLMALSFP